MIIMKEKIWQCPRCKNHVQGYGATSRRDDKTMICSCCGTEEAIFDFTIHQAKQKGETISQETIESEKAWLEV
jgi:hypothetical protein